MPKHIGPHFVRADLGLRYVEFTLVHGFAKRMVLAYCMSSVQVPGLAELFAALRVLGRICVEHLLLV